MTEDWYFQESDNINDYYAAIARQTGSSTIAILYFIEKDNTPSWLDLRAKEVILPNAITYAKV